jgi:hypothetical protein
VAWTRAALALFGAGAVALAVLSGGSAADPRTPAGLPGLPPPFLGTAVAGSGGLTAAIDAYGDVVDLRAPGPADRALIDNPADRQAAGSVAADTGIVPRVRVGGRALPLWRADSVSQRYLSGTNVVRTVVRFGPVAVTVVDAAIGETLAQIVRVSAPPGMRAVPSVGIDLQPGAGGRCKQERGARRLTMVCSAGTRPGRSAAAAGIAGEAEAIVLAAAAGDRRWVARARPLGSAAPAWARRMYARSLLTLRALSDRRTGALAAGARDGWAHVWPRDAGTAALAFAAAGYPREARRLAHFLLGLDLNAAARFDGQGNPVPGRAAQGDASGWVAAAAQATGLPSPTKSTPWRNRADYQEGPAGTYLANAIASPQVDGPKIRLYGVKSARRRRSVGVAETFAAQGGLARRAGDPGSGLDSAAAWAVRPFPLPALFPAVRQTLFRLTSRRARSARSRFGITPSEDWPGVDPWTAPTAWTAWSLAALSRSSVGGASPASALRDRRTALRLLGDLRRAATPAGDLPERVDARTGVPRSTTPLAWSHAFSILAMRELWPGDRGGV